MFDEILFMASLFITRIALPVLVTLLIGSLLERALHRDAPAAS